MGPNHAVSISSPLEHTGTTLPPSAHQAQENSTQAGIASRKLQSENKPGPQNPEKTYFPDTQNTSAKLSIIFFLVGFSLQETPSLVSLLSHSTLPLLRCPHGTPRAACPCPTQPRLHPSWLEQTNPRTSTFHHAAKQTFPRAPQLHNDIPSTALLWSGA